MSDHVDTPLVRDAWERALGRRQPGAGLIYHSDRGAQYASQVYRSILAAHGMACSMSGKGEGLDHAVAEAVSRPAPFPLLLQTIPWAASRGRSA
jgi:transposase InsO family protein